MPSSILHNEDINQGSIPTPSEWLCPKAKLWSKALKEFRRFFDDDLRDVDDTDLFWECIRSIEVVPGATRDIFILKFQFNNNKWFYNTTITKHIWRTNDGYCSKPVLLDWKEQDLSEGMLGRAMAAYRKGDTSDLRSRFTEQSFVDNPRCSMFYILGYFNPKSNTDDIFPTGGELLSRIRLFLDKHSCAFAKETPKLQAVSDALDEAAESFAQYKQGYCDKDLWQRNQDFCRYWSHLPVVGQCIATLGGLSYAATDALFHLVSLADFCTFGSDLQRVFLKCLTAEKLSHTENKRSGVQMITDHWHGKKHHRACGSEH